jgi:MinD superfamily P-loop ATPase
MERPLSLQIDPDLCQACPRCKAAQVCRLKALVQMDPGEQPYLEADRCRDCRVCLAACPHGAVRKI